ncbi:MAG TPA: hypothetical protein V6D12_18475, partial [Candidatus Obscuribacterales bacterium]
LKGLTGISQTTIVVLMVNQKDLGRFDLMVNQLFRSDRDFLLNSNLYFANNTMLAQHVSNCPLTLGMGRIRGDRE